MSKKPAPPETAAETPDKARDWDAPSENPEFLGATPGALAQALLRPTQPPKPSGNPATNKK